MASPVDRLVKQVIQLLEADILFDLFHSGELHLGHILGFGASSFIYCTHM